MFRLSPSLINSIEFYRGSRYEAKEDNDRVLRELIGSIKREDLPPSEGMKLGTAFHAVMEDPPAHFVSGDGKSRPYYEATDRGSTFRFDTDTVIEAVNSRPDGIPELKGQIDIQCGKQKIRIYLKPDLVFGNGVDEYKTTEKAIDASKYENSIQWRMYLHAFSLDWCKYRVVKLSKNRKTGIY